MRQWAVLIGLNNYQMFQPLNCAQQDAQVLHQFLIQEAGFPAEQCLLLTDTSPPISGRPTQPTRQNLQSWIELLVQQCFKPGDTLWFFFSGYGVCASGRDYLVPLDGDPFAVETTCILMSDIFSRLQSSISPGLPLVLLDVNRMQGTFSSENVGLQTARLAKQLAVPAILSCQPGQYSREISGLGHGLFTIALLEALRYYQGATPATLMRFLSDRLPELGSHYYLPNQQPLPLCPPDKLHQPLLQAHYSTQANEENNGNGHYSPVLDSPVPVESNPYGLAEEKSVEEKTAAIARADLPPGIEQPQPANLTHLTVRSNGNSTPAPTLLQASTNSHPPSVAPDPPMEKPLEKPFAEETPDPSSATLWRPMLLWGGLLSLGLIGCVVWRNWATIMAPTPIKTPVAGVPAPPIPTTSPRSPEGTATSANVGSSNVGSSTEVPSATSAPTTSGPAPTAPTPDALNFNPAATPVPIVGQTILATARKRVLSDQATPYRDAIDEARQVPNSDPSYVEAQQEIAAWSQRIFDISQQRAAQKQWDIAIMAADLVPTDDRKLRPQAQTAIAQWCPAIQARPADTFPMVRAKSICAQKPI